MRIRNVEMKCDDLYYGFSLKNPSYRGPWKKQNMLDRMKISCWKEKQTYKLVKSSEKNVR